MKNDTQANYNDDLGKSNEENIEDGHRQIEMPLMFEMLRGRTRKKYRVFYHRRRMDS